MNQAWPERENCWERALVASVSEYAIFRLTKTGEVASWNAGAERIKGYDAADIIGQHFSVFYPREDREAGVPAAALRKARETGQFEAEAWRLRKDGTRFWASILITPLRDPDGTLTGYAKIVRDVTDKRLAYDALKESERKFRLLVQGVTDYSIFMLSPEGNVTNWNTGAARIKGYQASEVIGTHFRRFYTLEDIEQGLPERSLEIAAQEGRFETEGWRVRKDGSRFWANVVIDAIRDEHGKLVGYAKITRDVTERKAAQEQLEHARAALLQAQKMEAIGKLTGGVAHNFNNVLQVLRGNLELLERRHGHDPASRERLSKAIGAVEHGANLASQLLAFGRRQALQPRVVNLANMLRNMEDMLRRALGELTEVETTVADDLWNTLVDPNQLETVVLNLAINGRDAMPEGGKLTLELTNVTLDGEGGPVATDVAAGHYVMLAVSDTGTGMDPEVLERAFEPYFSTKPEGEGTGLGLSMAYGVIKQSGGDMRIYSEPGHGTTVKVWLPRSTQRVVELEPAQPLRIAGGTETILVVEDDSYVQAAVVETLDELGYTVLKADDAQSAMAIVRSGVKIDLLFSDVVMPGPLSSTQLASMASHAVPGLKVLFTSGYAQSAIVHSGRLDEGVHLLSKPYSRAQLAGKVRYVLGLAAANQAASQASAQAATQAGDQSANQSTSQAGTHAAGEQPDACAGVQARPTLLVVDDESASREAVCELLAEMGYDVRQAGDEQEAMRELEDDAVQVLIADIALRGGSGIDLAKAALRLHPRLNVIFASGNEAPPAEETGLQCAALRKPFTAGQLSALIESVCGSALKAG
ncbi:PAS domain S-box protein [Paraburkholderia tagetis]|uniref:histidine kinase n=1 Tax=Paraburkholderia tagetis TaxID=2913261 RepID=A0A9X1RST2_9BURK|nr:PAS domain S-box protein [Paraburkholderia tagetis]MCG5075387.1 PAS domain S-box protein [Paraburkholderia tagetis]